MLTTHTAKTSTRHRVYGLQPCCLSIASPQSLIPFCMLVAACLIGCGSRPRPLPATYPVHGKVTCKDGTPVTEGVVQFQPSASLSVATAGRIRSDGTYSLTTMRDGLLAEGALAGPNRVIVLIVDKSSRSRQDPWLQRARTSSTVFPTFYTVEPKDNEHNLVVEQTCH